MANVLKYCVEYAGNLIWSRNGSRSNQFSKTEWSQVQDKETTTFYLTNVMQQIDSNLIHLQIEGFRQLKLHISKEGLILINAMEGFGLVPKLFEFLRHDDYDLVFEAISTLKLIVFGANPKIASLIDLDNYRVLCKLLFSTRFDIVEQIVWFVGGISLSQSSLKYVNKLLCQILLIQDHPEQGLPLIRALAWTLSGILIKNRKNTKLFLILILGFVRGPENIPTLSSVIAVFKNAQPVPPNYQTVYKTILEDFPIVTDQLTSDDNDIAILSLRIIGLMIYQVPTPSPAETENIFLSTLYEFLYHPQALLQYATMACIATIMFKSRDSCIAIANSDFLTIINGRLLYSEDHELKMQCLCIYTIFQYVVPEKVDLLIECGVLDAVCEFLKRFATTKVAKAYGVGILASFVTLAHRFGQLETALSKIKQSGGLDKLLELQNDSHERIALLATNLVDNYFSDNELPMIPNIGDDNDNIGDAVPLRTVSIMCTTIGYWTAD